MTIDVLPPTLGLVLAGGQARRMGGGDKALIRIGGAPSLTACSARLHAALRSDHPECQRRSGALCGTGSAGRARQRAGFCRPACRHSRRPRLGGGACARIEWMVSVPGDCPFLPADLVARLHDVRAQRRHAARLRALGRLAASGRRPLAGQAARGFAARVDRRRTCARSRSGPRVTASRWRIGRTSRSIRFSMSTRRKMPRRAQCGCREGDIRKCRQPIRSAIGRKSDPFAGLDVRDVFCEFGEAIGLGKRRQQARALAADILSLRERRRRCASQTRGHIRGGPSSCDI